MNHNNHGEEGRQTEDDDDEHGAMSTSSWFFAALIAFILPFGFLVPVVLEKGVAHAFRWLLMYTVSLVPAALGVRWILVSLATPAGLGVNAIVSQLVWMVFPTTPLIGIVEGLLAVTLGLVLFPSEAKIVFEALESGQKGEIDLTSISGLKLAVASVLFAFVVAALTEEVGKYLIGQRFKKLCEGVPTPLNPKAVVACFSAAGLGFAAVEHVQYSLSSKEDSLVIAFIQCGLRAALAYPVHVGTTFLMGVHVARSVCLGESVTVPGMLATPILIHGTFDAVAMVSATSPIVPDSWQSIVCVYIVQFGLGFYLLTLCGKRYSDLMVAFSGYVVSEV